MKPPFVPLGGGADLDSLTQQYGYSGGGGGGYGQTNPYEQQGGRYDQSAGNPYAQQASNPYAQQPAAPQGSYGGRQQQQQQQGGYDNQYTQVQSSANGGYGTLDCLVFRKSSNNVL